VKHYDALVVLGKNIGIGWTRNRIKKTKHFLSDRSEFSVMAGGILFKTGNFDKIIFSAGKTAGRNVPSEAQAMSDFLLLKFPGFPKDKIIKEEISVDTLQNAEEIKKIADTQNIKTLLVLTTPEHVKRTKMLFKKEGLNVDVEGSDEILSRLSPEIYQEFKYKTNPLEVIIENIAYLVQITPVIGNIAHIIVKSTRSKA
jgi:uncharacterized SAM-binding protein YcdF (DUF218 family)